MILFEVRLELLVIKLEFTIFSVSFRAFEIRLLIEDRRFLVKLLELMSVKFNSAASTSLYENVRIDNMPSVKKLTFNIAFKLVIIRHKFFIIFWSH